MESRRKFKADLNEKHIQDLFSRKKQRYSKVKKAYEESKRPDVLYNIPNDMLPSKKIKERHRELAKPENWVLPVIEPVEKMSRQEVFKKEKNNIKKELEKKRTTYRTAKFIDSAINPKSRQPLMKDVDSVEDTRNKLGSVTDIQSGLIERRNHSREFLQQFFSRADKLTREQEEEVRRIRREQTVKPKPPKLVWLEPGTDEIVL